MLEKREEVDHLAVVGPYKAIEIRPATIVMDDGAELARTRARRVLHPRTRNGQTWTDTDVTGEPADVQAICAAVWTAAIGDAFVAAMNRDDVTPGA